jgi:hypothetical protein
MFLPLLACPAVPSALVRLARSARSARCTVGVAFAALVFSMPASAQSRGELLYATHCISCHTTQMHWRDEKAATDWSSLKAQVRRWQGAISLGWSEDDIVEVARHLNQTIYRFEQTGDTRSSRGPLAPGPG